MQMNSDDILRKWQSERIRHPMFSEPGGVKMNDHWERCSSTYGAERYSSILTDIVDYLRESDLITGKRVIDIGSGPGTFAEPMSRFCHSILCTDISPGMLARVESLGINNISTFLGDCLNLPDSCIRDVSFCSLCPPMNCSEGLAMMEKMGKDLCIYVSSANPCGGLESKIWNALGKDYSYHGADTQFPADYLESLGISVELRFFTQLKEYDESEVDVADMMVRKISAYRPLTADDEKKIRDTVYLESEDGIIHTRTEFRMGMLIWEPGQL